MLIYPATDAGCDTPSFAEHAQVPNLTVEATRWFWEQFCPDDRRGEPEASVLRALDLRAVAPALVLTAEYDVLRGRGRSVCTEKAVDLTVLPRQLHGNTRIDEAACMPAAIERANHAIDEVAEAIRTALAVPVG